MSNVCPHPDEEIEFRSVSTNSGKSPQMWCQACRTVVMEVRDSEDFVQQREAKYLAETGNTSVIIADMFGTPIEIGSMIVYPSLSGRSAQMAYGEVVGINTASPPRYVWTDYRAARVRVDQPDSLKVIPVGTARWKKHYYSAPAGGSQKPITLTANAPSAVVIK